MIIPLSKVILLIPISIAFVVIVNIRQSPFGKNEDES